MRSISSQFCIKDILMHWKRVWGQIKNSVCIINHK